MGNKIQAAIIDLDGVVTSTATQHAKAWKKMFDSYNKERDESGKKTYSEFSIEKDYPEYIDGIPRYDGVKEFLKSKDIELPYGDPDDEPKKETICGLGNRKNEIFHQLIEKEGVDVYEDNVEQIRHWKKEGVKTAVISSSKNCKLILERTKLEDLFQVRVDGIISEEKNIKGKPAPDIFLEAAKKLDVSPGAALIVEDSQAGVTAGKKGNFRLVIGIIGASDREELLTKGADKAVVDLREVSLTVKEARQPEELPPALDNMASLKELFKTEQPLVFLDFDGTLAPIVENHKDAAMPDSMRELIKEMASVFRVAVISGRGLEDVKKRVQLENIYYAGSHGFEMAGPGGFKSENMEAQKVLSIFDELLPVLEKKLQDIEGLDFERKKYTLAVHYRKVKEEGEKEVHAIIEKTLKEFPKLKKGEGKKVIEIRPNIYWDKGKAVEMLKLKLSEEKQPKLIYIGDDVTDEDVFEFIQNGIGILVGTHGRNTFADYSLKNTKEVESFFKNILKN